MSRRNRLFKRFRDSRLSVKIIAMFTLVLVLTTALMFIIFNAEQRSVRYAEFDRIAQQNTQLIANNIDAMLNNASYATKMIITNSNVQRILGERLSFESPAVMQSLRINLSSFTNLQPYTAGIYLFNTTGQRFGVDNYTLHTFSFKQLEDAPWYQSVAALRGYYRMMLNSGEDGKLYGSENVVSMVRMIYNLNQQTDAIGAVMLNLREDFLISCFDEFEREYLAEVDVVDENGVSLLSRSQMYFDALSAEQRARLMSADRTVVSLPVQQEGHVSYSSVKTRKAPWQVLVALPYTGAVKDMSEAGSWFILLLVMEVLLIFLATLMITRMVARPLHQLTGAMTLHEGEHPTRVDIDCADDEIGLLKDTYNGMVDRLEAMFGRIEAESERKRQAEFHALQAQINPHFLYNTIDTARGLTLMGRGADVNRLLRNLGEFYRNSINNGRNVITLREEIQMVKSYMDIQQIRYEDVKTVYDVDDSACDVQIPKLVLQPLVENALYHGLRPNGNKGVVTVRVWQDETSIYVSISDDGVGIPPDVIAKVFDPRNDPLNRFGLQGTIDRLRLFYRQERVLSIECGVDKGTRMTITIPKGTLPREAKA